MSRFSGFIRISNTYNWYIVGAQDTQLLADHGIAISRPSNSFDSAKSFVVKCLLAQLGKAGKRGKKTSDVGICGNCRPCFICCFLPLVNQPDIYAVTAVTRGRHLLKA